MPLPFGRRTFLAVAAPHAPVITRRRFRAATVGSVKVAPLTAELPRNHFAPRSVLREFLKRVGPMYARVLMTLCLFGGSMFAQMPQSLYPWWSNKPVVKQLDLTPEQVRQIRAAVSESHPHLLEVRAKVLRAEQNLEDQFNRDPVDQSKTNQAIEELIAARTDLTRSLSELSLKLRVLLTAQQWQQLQRLRPNRDPNDLQAPR
jgi:Spy/CpxP family protein refolding chaperone